MKDKQEARNTAAGMVRDALQQLVNFEAVKDLRYFENTKEEATRLLEFAQDALNYFESHYDFPQCRYTVAYATYNRNEGADALECGVFPSDYATEAEAHDAALAQIRREAEEEIESNGLDTTPRDLANRWIWSASPIRLCEEHSGIESIYNIIAR